MPIPAALRSAGQPSVNSPCIHKFGDVRRCHVRLARLRLWSRGRAICHEGPTTDSWAAARSACFDRLVSNREQYWELQSQEQAHRGTRSSPTKSKLLPRALCGVDPRLDGIGQPCRRVSMVMRRQFLWSGAPHQTTVVDPALRRLHRAFNEAPRCRKVERRDRERA